METQKTETTGTPELDGGDAAQADGRDASEAGRDAESKEPDYKTMYLEAKGKVERTNALEAENAELRSRAEQPPAAQPNGQGAEDEAYWADVKHWADKGDAVAKAMLNQRDEQERMAYAMSATYELLDIEDRDTRRAVAKHMQRNANRNLDVRAARSEVEAQKLAKERLTLAEENAKLKSALEAAQKKPPTDVIRTATREITSQRSGNTTESMTEAEFDQRQAELKAQGPAGHKLALKEQLRLDRDEIVLRKY